MKVKAMLHAEYNKYAEAGQPRFSFMFYPCDMSKYGYIYLGEFEVDVKPPTEKKLVLKQIECLREKEQQVQAEAFNVCEQIRDEVQALLCLEDKSND